jgi:hypothetical protein
VLCYSKRFVCLIFFVTAWCLCVFDCCGITWCLCVFIFVCISCDISWICVCCVTTGVLCLFMFVLCDSFGFVRVCVCLFVCLLCDNWGLCASVGLYVV